ncbi:MAG: aconitase/3-isopropylmalate dehydratase large subunit family protein [Thermodesulfobacteriota bacterium]|nr:aconitase/3-isopropylmalate dehydratase large subunit family protein [Thermodesulfobacteriota bacterium]
MGMTIAEKILASHSGKEYVRPGEYIWAYVDGTHFAAHHITRMDEYNLERVFDPDRIYVVDDHLSLPPSIAVANAIVKARQFVRKWGIKNFFEYGRHGVQHELFPQHGYVSPGDLIASLDSHTTSAGCFNVASCPIYEEVPYVVSTGKLWFRVPRSIKFVLEGEYPGPDKFVVGKDIILRILVEYGSEIGLYKSVEFHGPVVRQMSMASRFTIANMGVELGAKFAIFPCDEKTLEYLKDKMKRPPHPVFPDPDATYEAIYPLDVTDMSPYVACPPDPTNGLPAEKVEPERIKIDQAFIGSCTNGRVEDFRMAAKILKGRKIHPDVRLIATPASQQIWYQCSKEGIWDIFSEAEAVITHSTCGICCGYHLGLLGDGEVSISSTNRNFEGRQGSSKASVYLANPATVAASAVTGYITDPRNFL